MVRKLRLYCARVVERGVHRSHVTVHGAFTGSSACPLCGLDPAAIVDAVAIGLVGEPPGPAALVAQVLSRPTRVQMEAGTRGGVGASR